MKKLFATLIAVLSASAIFLTACGSKIDRNDPQKLEIYLYNAGYGYEWAEEILKAFKEEPWVKEKYPELKTSFEKDELSSRAPELVQATKRINKYEIIMSTNLESVISPTTPILDLTEVVYNSQVPGEDILFKDKLIPSYLSSAVYNDASSADERFYAVNWASGMTGIIYNEDKLNALGKDVPNTTNELVKIMQDVKVLDGGNSAYDQTYSFVTYTSSSYAYYLFYTWWAQYQKTAEYINFFNGVDSATNSRSPAIFSQSGLLKSLEVLESFMHRDNGMTWLNPNTGREAYRETQNKVLLGTGLFMANGDWVDNELKDLRDGLVQMNGRADKVKMMRTPIISSIIENTPTITDDQTLSKVIEAIDNGLTSYDGVSEEDFATIEAARKVVYSLGPNHHALIPEYASGKEVAVDFMRYLATDKANEIYIKKTNGASLPFNYNLEEKNAQLFSEISPMQQDRLNYFSQLDIDILPAINSFPLARFGGLSPLKSGNPMIEFTSGATKGSYSTLAERLYNREISYWTENSNLRWKNCLVQSGM